MFQNNSYDLWPSLSGFRLLILLSCGFLTLGGEALAQCSFDPDKTPAVAVPAQLWGELEPMDLGVFPESRDNSGFDQIGDFEVNPYTMALDAEDGWVFVARNRRLEIWDANSVPGLPARTFDQGFRQSGLTWTPDAHAFFIFEDVDAPPGNPDLLTVAGRYGVGFAVYDTSDKTEAELIYQDHGSGRWAADVYAGAFGGREYAFVSATATNPAGGAFMYDLTAAKNLTTPCIESQPGGTSPCPGVFLGRLTDRTHVPHLDGADHFVALSGGAVPEGFEIWDVADPLNPVQVMNVFIQDRVYDLALWQDDGSYYLAAHFSREGRIYDVSCIADGALCAPVFLTTLPGAVQPSPLTISFSRSGLTPFLYLGTEAECIDGFQNEWLFDVSDPTNPRDVTPPGTAVINGQSTSYWGWYYWENGVHGFNRVAPRMGKFDGPFFYRAGFSIFDSHRWLNPGGIFADGFESGDTTSWSRTVIE